jgi:hypothetical protein
MTPRRIQKRKEDETEAARLKAAPTKDTVGALRLIS